MFAALALCLAQGCGSGEKPVDKESAAQVAACAQALADSVPERGRAKLETLITGCSQVCPELSREVAIPAADNAGATPIIEACGGYCTDSARRAWQRAEPGRGYAALVRECGPESYGLTADSGPLLSDTWLLLLRMHEWLEQHRRHADERTRHTLESAGMHAHFSLPLPPYLEGVYSLPTARAGRPMDKAFYAMLASAPGPAGAPEVSAVRAAAVPVARLRPSGLEQRPLPGGYFPGKLLRPPEDDYRARYRMLEGMHPTAAHSTIDPTPALLLDRRAPVTELLTAMRALGTSEIALGVSGHTAQVHAVLIRRAPRTGSGAPILRKDASGYALMSDRELKIPVGEGARAQLAAALAELSVTSAPIDTVEIQLEPDADIDALVALMDLLAEARFKSILVRS